MTLLEQTKYDALVDGLLNAGETHDPRSTVIELLGEVGNVWPESVSADDQAGRLVESATALIDLYGHEFAPHDQVAATDAIDLLLACLPAETRAAVMAMGNLTATASEALGKMDHGAFMDVAAA